MESFGQWLIYTSSALQLLLVLIFCIAATYKTLLTRSSTPPDRDCQPSLKMKNTARTIKPARFGTPCVVLQQEADRDTSTTDERAKAESASSTTATKEEGGRSNQDICSSKTVSDRGDDTELQLKRDGEEAKPGKEGSSSPASKEGEASGRTSSEKGSTGGPSRGPRGWDQNEELFWLHCVNNHCS